MTRARTVTTLCLIAPLLAAQTAKTPAADWPTYNRDLAATRFSPLTQINTGNVTRLAQAWSYFLLAGRAGTAGGTYEVTPLVVGGIMYLPAGDRVVALDPETGKESWRYELGKERASPRGVAYWPGDRNNPPRIIFTTASKLVALNANTGKLDPGFGKEGQVDMVVPYNGVPTVYKNVVTVGASTGEKETGPPGNTRAWDARTGAKLWEFQTVPLPGQLGHDTWLDDGWKNRSGTNTWGWFMTVDEARGLIYLPLGAPTANYYGGDRPGANLFGNSVVAVDAATGKYKWHFQVVHHDLWDFDLPPGPSLVDIVKDGKKISALAQVGKSGYMFILDRTTGKPVFGVEERPVPKGDVPGEWYSPTQPFPVKPPPLSRVSLKKEDLVSAEDTTPEHAKACQEMWDHAGGFDNQGPFTPFRFHPEAAPPQSSVQFPGATGGPSWGGLAVDPRTGFLYLQTHDSGLTGWIEKKRPGVNYESVNLPYDRGNVEGTGGARGFSATARDASGKVLGNWPCQKPPWARMIAINANTGDIAWQVPLGTTPGLPEGKQKTGNTGSGGPIVTAGGLVFMGAANDARFRAFDAKTGQELWAGQMARPAIAVPMTYQGKSGKQYVAITATDTVVAFALQ
jgi:quinoprotein glucose dehydrogenase